MQVVIPDSDPGSGNDFGAGDDCFAHHDSSTGDERQSESNRHAVFTLIHCCREFRKCL
jgi:hypothetical protein